MINWCYETVLSAFSAANPGLRESGCPNKPVDFAAAPRNFPDGPVMLLFDVSTATPSTGNPKQQGFAKPDKHKVL